jgi:hypothetical protein
MFGTTLSLASSFATRSLQRLQFLLLAAVLPVPAQLCAQELVTGDVLSQLDAGGPRVGSVGPASREGLYQIDLLVLQTPTYQARVGSATAVSEPARLIELANSYFQNSDMPIQYQLVGVRGYFGTTEREPMDGNLKFMREDPVLAALRDELSADMVLLLRTADFGGAANCGMARPFNNGITEFPPAHVDSERDAYAVVAGAASVDGINCPDVEHLVAHELGHVLGGGHQDMGGPTAWRPYAHAWPCGIALDVGPDHASVPSYTVMFANTGVTGDIQWSVVGNPRADLFSSPDLSLDGIPCGQMQTPDSGADNARAMTEAAPYVSAYRTAGARRAGDQSQGGSMGPLMLLTLAEIWRRRSLRRHVKS